MNDGKSLPDDSAIARDGRHLCQNLVRLIDQTIEEFAEAKHARDAGAYRNFNNTYAEMQQQLEKVEAAKEMQGESERRRMEDVANRARETLEAISPFSDEEIENPDAVEKFTRRLARTGISEGPSQSAPTHNPVIPSTPPVVPREAAQASGTIPPRSRNEEPPDPAGEDGGGNQENYATPPLVRSPVSGVAGDNPALAHWGDAHPVSPLQAPVHRGEGGAEAAQVQRTPELSPYPLSRYLRADIPGVTGPGRESQHMMASTPSHAAADPAPSELTSNSQGAVPWGNPVAQRPSGAQYPYGQLAPLAAPAFNPTTASQPGVQPQATYPGMQPGAVNQQWNHYPITNTTVPHLGLPLSSQGGSYGLPSAPFSTAFYPAAPRAPVTTGPPPPPYFPYPQPFPFYPQPAPPYPPVSSPPNPPLFIPNMPGEEGPRVEPGVRSSTSTPIPPPPPSIPPSRADSPVTVVDEEPRLLRPAYLSGMPDRLNETRDSRVDEYAGSGLFRLQTEMSARDMLVSQRPLKENRYSGEDNSVDFEATLHQFEMVTNIEGVTDRTKFLEIRHYFKGQAAKIVALYESESDPAKGLKRIKKHLRREFGA